MSFMFPFLWVSERHRDQDRVDVPRRTLNDAVDPKLPGFLSMRSFISNLSLEKVERRASDSPARLSGFS